MDKIGKIIIFLRRFIKEKFSGVTVLKIYWLEGGIRDVKTEIQNRLDLSDS